MVDPRKRQVVKRDRSHRNLSQRQRTSPRRADFQPFTFTCSASPLSVRGPPLSALTHAGDVEPLCVDAVQAVRGHPTHARSNVAQVVREVQHPALGELQVGAEVVFSPGARRARVRSIESMTSLGMYSPYFS